jgi:hypothetical protein
VLGRAGAGEKRIWAADGEDRAVSPCHSDPRIGAGAKLISNQLDAQIAADSVCRAR